MNRTRGLVALACAALLAACSANTSATSNPTAAAAGADLIGSSWTLTGVAINQAMTPAVDDTASLNFNEDHTVSGSTGCNQFSGSWTSEGSHLTIVPGPMTLMACVETAAQEQAVIAALTATRTYAIASDTLTLEAEDGTTVATYSRASSGLANTSWQATGVNNGKGAVVSTTLTETLSLVLHEGGGLEGFGGCTAFMGSYTAEGSDVSISGLTPAGTCSGTAEESSLQDEYLAALAAATQYRVDGNTLELRDDEGALQVGLIRTR